MGGAVFPPCYLTWGQTMVELMKIMVTSFKSSPARTATLSPRHPPPKAGHHQPTCLLETAGRVWVSLLWGHCSFLLGPDAQGSVCALQESVSPVLCKFWLYDVVHGYLLQEGLCHIQVTAPRATSESYLLRRQSNTVLSQSLWGLRDLVRTRFVWALWAFLVGIGFDSKCDFAPPTVLLGLLCPWTWGISLQLLHLHAAASSPKLVALSKKEKKTVTIMTRSE